VVVAEEEDNSGACDETHAVVLVVRGSSKVAAGCEEELGRES
jgi:hypothetical protein